MLLRHKGIPYGSGIASHGRQQTVGPSAAAAAIPRTPALLPSPATTLSSQQHPSSSNSHNLVTPCIRSSSSSSRRQQQRTGSIVVAATSAAAATDEPAASASAATTDDSNSTSADSDLSVTVDEPTSFQELGVDPLLIAGMAEEGIEVPSPIQEAAIPVLLSGCNAAIQSYTGSGKTLAYLLPSLTLALKRAEAAYRRRQAAVAASRSSSSSDNGGGGGRVSLREEDLWTVQVLVIAPSQELAMQITRVAQGLFPKDSRTAVQQAIGGANIRRQANAIAEHQPIMVVGTPGRVVDLVGMGVLRLHRTPLLVLDEADQLLGDVYARHINTLMQHCGKRLGGAAANGGSSSSSSNGDSSSSSGSEEHQQQQQQDELLQPTRRQTVLVSATLWSGGLARFEPWCPSPEFVTMGASPTWSDEFTSGAASGQGLSDGEAAKTWGWGAKGWEGPASVVQAGPKTQGSVGGPEGQGLVPTLPPQLEHMYIVVNPDRKSDVLRRALHALNINMGLGFMNWQQRLKDMAAKVAAKKIEVEALHGELQPSERGAIFDAARNGAYRLLLVSDLAARGLDMPQVDAVFNLELPSSAAHYAHRAGRTGRMGAPGLVITLVAPGERFVVERLSKKLGVPIVECHLAGGELVVGPPPKKERKKKKETDGGPAVGDELRELQQQLASTTSSSSSSGAKQRGKQPGAQEAAAAAAAKVPGSKSGAGALAADGGITFDPEAAAFDVTSVKDNVIPDESGLFLLDEADDVEVEGDEPLEVYRERLRKEMEAELLEIQQERKQRRQAAAAAAGEAGASAGGGGSVAGGRRVRRSSRAGVPKGSPQEAAAMAIAAIEADEAAKKARARLPPELLGGSSSSGGGSSGGGNGGGGRKPRGGGGGARKPSRTR